MNLNGGNLPIVIASIGEDIRDSLNNIVERGYLFIEKLIPAIILFAIGIVIAKIFKAAITMVLKNIGIDGGCERIGVTGMLSRANIKAPVSEILGKLVFWGLVLLFLTSAIESLQMPEFSAPLYGLIAFLPRVLTATMIFMAGFIASDLLRGIILKAGERMGLDFARPLASLIYGFLLVLVGTICVGTLGVDITLIRHTVEIVLIAGALAIALAMGLGMRPLTQNIIAGVYVRDNFKPGTRVRVKELDIDATVLAVGPVSTRLTSDSEEGEEVVLPNHTMISSVVKARKAAEDDDEKSEKPNLDKKGS